MESSKKNITEKILLIIFVMFIVLLSELLDPPKIIMGNVKLAILPLVLSVLLGILIGVPLWRKGILKTIYSDNNINFIGANVIFFMLPLMARYGGDIVSSIETIAKSGWILIVQCIGNIGTVLIGLPIALLLGLNRQAIGTTLGIGREGELTYITEKFTLDSEEGKGIISIYLLGTLFGAVIFSFMPVLVGLFGFSENALAIGCGLGSFAMMTAGAGAVAGMYPNDTQAINGLASAANVATSICGLYVMLFLSIPLMNLFYRIFKHEKAFD